MRLLSLVLIWFTATTAFAGDSWPSFQNGGEVSYPSASAVELGEVQWTARLEGYGQSSPVVWDQQIYVTTVEGDHKDNCHVTAFQLKDGKQLWRHTVKNASPAESSNYISRAAPTPAVDADGVVCLFEGGNIVALAHDGTQRWERNLVADYGDVKARHGLSSSLEQDTDSVFVWIERSEDPYVVSLNKNTGETEWKSKGLGATSWASPRLVDVDGGRHLVLSASGSLAGFDPESGEQLWLFDGISGNSTPTPMPLGGGRFLIGATTGRGESGGGRAAESNGVIQITQEGNGKWSADYLWKAKRATSSFGSPIVHEGTAYFINREGVLYGLNAETGDEIFVKRLQESSWATPIGLGKQVFCFGKNGKVQTVSDLASSQKVAIWDGLSGLLTTRTAGQEAGSIDRSPGVASDAVLYAAAICNDCMLLRCGDVLSSVSLHGVEKASGR